MASTTALVKENESLSRAMARVRTNMKATEQDVWRKGTGLAASFVVGALEKNGKLAELPTIPGVPRIVTLGVITNVAAMFAPAGKIRQALDGAGESMLNIASYKWGRGEDVAGVGEIDVGGPRARHRRTAAALREKSDEVRQLESQMQAQVNEELAARGGGASPADPILASYIDVPAY